MEDLKQQQWTIACKIFVDEKGNPYVKNKIRLLKKPSLTSKLLERAVNNLK